MLTKTNRWIVALLATMFILLFVVLIMPNDVSAAPSFDTASNYCLTCHEDLYYLHDTGCWYCMTDAHKDRCTDCHEGIASVMNKDQAHFGLIAHPQENNGAKCQECHADDSQARVDAFASGSGGFATVIKAEAYTPAAEVEGGFPSGQEESQLAKNWAWLVGGVVFFGFWLALVFLSPQKP